MIDKFFLLQQIKKRSWLGDMSRISGKSACQEPKNSDYLCRKRLHRLRKTIQQLSSLKRWNASIFYGVQPFWVWRMWRWTHIPVGLFFCNVLNRCMMRFIFSIETPPSLQISWMVPQQYKILSAVRRWRNLRSQDTIQGKPFAYSLTQILEIFRFGSQLFSESWLMRWSCIKMWNLST